MVFKIVSSVGTPLKRINVMSQFVPFEEVFEREKLHFAAQDGDIKEVKRLLKEGYQPNLFDELGKTPLH